MQTPNPKTMARILRETLSGHGMTIPHSLSLEVVAKQLGHADWNTLSAKMDPKQPIIRQDGRLPEGWVVYGRSDLFTHDLAPQAGPDGSAAIVIGSRAPQETVGVAHVGEFLTVMQRISAVPYRGKTVSFRAHIRCAGATGLGRIWINARSAHSREAIAFDNLGLDRGPNAPVTGDAGWSRRTVTIDVPEAAIYIGFGVLFGSGMGHFMAGDLSFGPAEDHERPRELPETPRNMALAP